MIYSHFLLNKNELVNIEKIEVDWDTAIKQVDSLIRVKLI
jgi:hypothetical protein